MQKKKKTMVWLTIKKKPHRQKAVYTEAHYWPQKNSLNSKSGILIVITICIIVITDWICDTDLVKIVITDSVIRNNIFYNLLQRIEIIITNCIFGLNRLYS